MDNNHINNHICNNNNRRMERNFYGRMDNEMMHRREENSNCDGELFNHLDYYDQKSYCNRCDHRCDNEYGGDVYVLNVEKSAYKNKNYRVSAWTGKYLQMTLMSISPSRDVGVETHKDADQYIRVEHGYALALTGCDPKCLNEKKKLCTGDAIFIPAGTWHNIVNVGRCELKISSVYAPPHHPKCTEQKYNH